MSSPKPNGVEADIPMDHADDIVQGPGREEEGEGEDVGMEVVMDDSSEEEEDDEEEAQRIREGFIVDEDEEEEEDEEDEGPKKRRKRRKRHHRREETLEDDDLELLKENTGGVFRKKSRLSRLRHRSHSPKRRTVVESSDDDLSTGEQPRVVDDISKIWDDDREDEDEDDFIEYSDEEAREARKEEKRQEMRRKRAQVRPELVGIDANAWDELHDVFGDGHDYDWALVGDDEVDREEEQRKADMKYEHVFEPSEIKKRKLTEDDDLIRAMDTPERMQLATSSLSENSALSLHTQLTEEDIGGAAMWVSQRLSHNKKFEKFFAQDGIYQNLSGALVMAVTYVLRQLFVEEYEVPYIWAHKRDYICYYDPQNECDLLGLEDLWLVYSLGQKFRSLLERQKAIASLYQRLQVRDTYYEEEIKPHLDTVEIVADATEWLSLKYKDKKEDPAAEFRFHDDEELVSEKKRKMPSRISAYEVARKTIVVKLVEKFGLQAHQLVQNFNAGRHIHFAEDVDVNPIAFAEQFVDPDPIKAQTPEDLLKKARLILSTELGKDPLLRNHVRALFREEARITVEPTERGIYKIEESHPYFSFKYLRQMPIVNMFGSPQFLHILEAEKENIVTVSLTIPSDVKDGLERKLTDAFSSDNFTEAAKAWNAERSLVIQETLEQHLIPAGVKWIREVLRDEVEDLVANGCGDKLRTRINQRPYFPKDPKAGDFACSVLVISWGKGDPHKDAITLVYLDEAGRLRDHAKIDNLYDQDNLDEFLFLLDRRKPDVAVVGGFSIATLKLMQRVKEVLRGTTGPDGHGWGSNSKVFDIPVIYVHDDVARIYQHSKRAAQEFTALSPTAKYCVGLARYVQSPLNEFAALGPDITAISFDEESQNLVPKDKLFFALEQALIDVTNQVGVEINRTVTDSYYQQLLPFVCGLGPRKAEVLIQKIISQGGLLVNRDQFIKGGLLTTKIFLNAAGFLRITHQGSSSKNSRNHPSQHEDAPDPLDDTRIHPEDYELARKMAMDALELDEEDIHNEHPSHVVTLLMQDNDRAIKLDELNLDEFATSLYEANHDQKRFVLNVIRKELVSPFAETRKPFKLPSDQEILTMLTGETTKTFGVGLIVSALVYRIQRDRVFVRLDSGIEGSIPADLLSDQVCNAFDLVKKGQAITAIVTNNTLRLAQDDFYEITLSGRSKHLEDGDDVFRRGAPLPEPPYWDRDRLEKDKEMLQRKKRAENERSRRVIKHPNFHNLKSAEAETYLEKQQRGDVVIRPSSKGTNHLAVTWKVDDKLYQHIDVMELNNNDPTGHTVGGMLIIDPKHTYSDLDELIVNHVQAMARRVEDLMAHEKFKHGPEDDLHLFLKNYVTANPSKSMYGFTLNRKRPGHFNLCFLANKNSTVQSWPVRVAPEAYYLFDAPAVGVPELCDAFKVRHLHESQNYASAAASGRTPFGAGMRTPARPGGVTPGHMSVRQVGRTPNPYAGGQTPFVPPNLPSSYGPPQPMYGYPPPVHPLSGPPPPMPPSNGPALWGAQPSGNW